MSLTRAEAEVIAKEARDQGWEGDRHTVKLSNGEEYNAGYGYIQLHDWDQIDARRIELGNEPLGGRGCSVELHWPDLGGPKYWITDTDEWRRLKAKVDEIKEIIKQVHQHGWTLVPYSGVQKAGKFGMTIEVAPPGGGFYDRARVGGMRTWRKLLRQHTPIEGTTATEGAIEGTIASPQAVLPEGSPSSVTL